LELIFTHIHSYSLTHSFSQLSIVIVTILISIMGAVDEINADVRDQKVIVKVKKRKENMQQTRGLVQRKRFQNITRLMFEAWGHSHGDDANLAVWSEQVMYYQYVYTLAVWSEQVR
jgi:hypothetical protein